MSGQESMNEIISIAEKVVSYIKNPYCKELTEESRTSIPKLFLVVLAMSFTLNFTFILIIGLFEQMGLFSMESHAINKMFEDFSPAIIILLAVIVAPVVEELIFRGPLTLFCRYRKAFKWIFYVFAIVFGYIHITNYHMTTNVLLISPILVAPQILLGLFLGMIRVQYGLIYSILFHAIYNAILVVPSVLLYTPETA